MDMDMNEMGNRAAIKEKMKGKLSEVIGKEEQSQKSEPSMTDTDMKGMMTEMMDKMDDMMRMMREITGKEEREDDTNLNELTT